MLYVRYILFLFLICIYCSFQSPQYYTIIGNITFSTAYCGGAEPDAEVLRAIELPKPFAYKKLYYRPGKLNNSKIKASYIITDSLGNFKVKLKAPEYVFFEERKMGRLYIPPNTKTEKYDIACLKKDYLNGDFKVNNKQKHITYNYFIPCPYAKPCMQYTGQLVPMAAPK